MPEEPTGLAAAATAAGRMAIDTEFVSERRYRALLCLVQVAVAPADEPAAARIEVLDPLAELDPAPVASVLADPAVEVVLHAGRQDVALLRRSWKTEVRSVFDTQVAAAFLGYGAQQGYADLVTRVLGVRVGRSEGFTKWDARPLSADQLRYARADVEHLLELAADLRERLQAAGRLAWAEEECRPLEAASDERDLESVYRRLPRVRQLSRRARGIAWALVDWRERTARALDRPATWLLPDHVLVEVARRAPDSRGALAGIRGMPEATLHRRGADLLEAIAAGAEAAPPALPDHGVNSDPRDAPLLALAQALVRHRALEANLATELVATQADLGAVVAAARAGAREPEVRTLRGWRRELVGDELIELLDGRRSLGVGADHRLRVEPARRVSG